MGWDRARSAVACNGALPPPVIRTVSRRGMPRRYGTELLRRVMDGIDPGPERGVLYDVFVDTNQRIIITDHVIMESRLPREFHSPEMRPPGDGGFVRSHDGRQRACRWWNGPVAVAAAPERRRPRRHVHRSAVACNGVIADRRSPQHAAALQCPGLTGSSRERGSAWR